MHIDRVRVYWNFHKKTFSVQTKTPKGWRLSCHRPFIRLANVRFIVSEAGRERVLRERRKNVHAFVEGDMAVWELFDVDSSFSVSYNPYAYPAFYNLEAGPVHEAVMADLYIDGGRPVILVQQ